MFLPHGCSWIPPPPPCAPQDPDPRAAAWEPCRQPCPGTSLPCQPNACPLLQAGPHFISWAQMRPREVKRQAQGHGAGEQQSWGSKPCLWVSTAPAPNQKVTGLLETRPRLENQGVSLNTRKFCKPPRSSGWNQEAQAPGHYSCSQMQPRVPLLEVNTPSPASPSLGRPCSTQQETKISPVSHILEASQIGETGKGRGAGDLGSSPGPATGPRLKPVTSPP